MLFGLHAGRAHQFGMAGDLTGEDAAEGGLGVDHRRLGQDAVHLGIEAGDRRGRLSVGPKRPFHSLASKPGQGRQLRQLRVALRPLVVRPRICPARINDARMKLPSNIAWIWLAISAVRASA